MAATAPRCYLDIAIGDREQHAADLEAHERAQKFYQQVAGQVMSPLAAAAATSDMLPRLQVATGRCRPIVIISPELVLHLHHLGLQYGWSGGLEALDADAQEVFQEVRCLAVRRRLANNAGWAPRGRRLRISLLRCDCCNPSWDACLATPVQAYSSDPAWASQGPALVVAPRLAGGRLVIELSAIREAPKACENFRCLCTGEKGLGKASGKPLHYKGVRLHRVQQGFVVQGGDVVKVRSGLRPWAGRAAAGIAG